MNKIDDLDALVPGKRGVIVRLFVRVMLKEWSSCKNIGKSCAERMALLGESSRKAGERGAFVYFFQEGIFSGILCLSKE